jgi:hypothetical protein
VWMTGVCSLVLPSLVRLDISGTRVDAAMCRLLLHGSSSYAVCCIGMSNVALLWAGVNIRAAALVVEAEREQPLRPRFVDA